MVKNPPSHRIAANSNKSKKVHKLQKVMKSIDVERCTVNTHMESENHVRKILMSHDKNC